MKLRTTLPFLALLFAPTMHAQEMTKPDGAPVKAIVPGIDDTNLAFIEPEVMPSFPGGEAEMFKSLGQNVKYPTTARDAGIEGVVYVTFVIATDGSIDDANVLRGIGGGCDEEALRVVNSMPNWTPGTQDGKPVKVQYNLPIRFTLNEPKKPKK